MDFLRNITGVGDPSFYNIGPPLNTIDMVVPVRGVQVDRFL